MRSRIPSKKTDPGYVERGRNFQTYLRPSLVAKLDAEARRRGISRSAMIAAWIERAKWGSS